MINYRNYNKHFIAVLAGLIVMMLILPACGRPKSVDTPMDLPDEYEIADDFSRPNTGWARFDTEATAAYSLAGELYLEDRGQGVAAISPLSGKVYVDQTVDLQIRHVQGSVNNWMGVVLRMQDDDNYYLAAISADGFVLVMEVINGIPTALYGPEYSAVINQGKAENHLKVMLENTDLHVWVNEEAVASVKVSSINAAGTTALFADAVNTRETVVIAFDDFLLTTP